MNFLLPWLKLESQQQWICHHANRAQAHESSCYWRSKHGSSRRQQDSSSYWNSNLLWAKMRRKTIWRRNQISIADTIAHKLSAARLIWNQICDIYVALDLQYVTDYSRSWKKRGNAPKGKRGDKVKERIKSIPISDFKQTDRYWLGVQKERLTVEDKKQESSPLPQVWIRFNNGHFKSLINVLHVANHCSLWINQFICPKW